MERPSPLSALYGLVMIEVLIMISPFAFYWYSLYAPTLQGLPEDYGMINMFADVGTDHRVFSRLSPRRFMYLAGFVFPFFEHHRKDHIMGTPERNYRVIFSRVDEPGRPSITVNHVTDLTAKMTPVVMAKVELTAQGGGPKLGDVAIPPRRSFWGDITMPMF